MITFDNGGRLVENLNELPNLQNAKQLYLDVETTSFDRKVPAFQPYHGHRIAGICVTADDHPGAWYLPIRCHHEKWNLPLQPVLDWTRDVINTCDEWVNHSIKYDAHFLRQDNIDFNCRLVDTNTLAKIVNSDRFGFELDVLSKEWLHEDISPLEHRLKAYLASCKSKDYGDVPGDIIGEYGCQDVLTNRKLDKYLRKNRHEQTAGVWETEILLTPVLFDMEVTGLRVDPQELMKKQYLVLYEMSKLEEELHQLTGIAVRPHTNPDCYEVLCTKYGLPVLGYTDKGEPSFDKFALISYLSHPVVQASVELTAIVKKIQRYRKLHTLNGFFIAPYREHEINGLMHPDYNQIIRTGRLSCRRPNAQQLSPEAKELVHPEPGHVFIRWDYCLPAGSLIPTPYGDKPIEEVAHNLLPVLSLTDDNNLQFCEISRGARVGHGPIYKITFDDDTTFECTGEHPLLLYNSDEFIKCRDLVPGTQLTHIIDNLWGQYPAWGQVHKHRLAMEWAIDSKTEGDLDHVHHTDKDKTNWQVGNLELMDSIEHASMHSKENYKKQDHTLRIGRLREALKNRRSYADSGNPNWQGGKLMVACEICGKPIICWPSQQKKTCSHECQIKQMSLSHTKAIIKNTCEYCGKETQNRKRTFCSRTCANRARAEYGRVRQKNHCVLKVEYVRNDWFYSITVPKTGCYVTTNGLVNKQSQIEFRLIVHYIKDAAAIAAYQENPNTDFHQWVADMCGIPRKPAKNVNFCIGYGGGKAKVISMLASNMELVGNLAGKVDVLIKENKIHESQRQQVFELLCARRGEQVYHQYHGMLPGLKSTTARAARNLQLRGFVFNAYGRHRHLPLKAAYRAFNTVNQSTAADIIKERTVALAPRYNQEIRKLGIKFNASVHDETLANVPIEVANNLPVLKRLTEMFEDTAVKFRVPIKMSCGKSELNWAIASSDDGDVTFD